MLGRELILGFIGGALWHALQKRILQDGSVIPISRKPGIQRAVKVVRQSDDSCIVEISLPANIQEVQREISAHLPSRTQWNLQEREYYEEIFRAVDLKKRELTLLAIGARLWPHKAKLLEPDRITRSVKDLLDAFRDLAAKLGIPL